MFTDAKKAFNALYPERRAGNFFAGRLDEHEEF
jgi:hypothetical protein